MIGAVVAAVLAGALAFGPPPARSAERLNPRRHARRAGRGAVWVALTVAAALGSTALFGQRPLLWGVVVVIAAATAGRLVVGRRHRLSETRAAEECAHAARVLASLMRSGSIPHVALSEAAVDFPILASAAAAARLGGDVGLELARASEGPGRQGMRSVAAAWQLSERTGAPVADVLARVSGNLRRQRQLDAVVATELAAARTSGHIMALLPFLAVGLGLAAGVNTVGYLVREPVGQVLVLVSVTLTSVGVLWVDRLARTGTRASRWRP